MARSKRCQQLLYSDDQVQTRPTDEDNSQQGEVIDRRQRWRGDAGELHLEMQLDSFSWRGLSLPFFMFFFMNIVLGPSGPGNTRYTYAVRIKNKRICKIQAWTDQSPSMIHPYDPTADLVAALIGAILKNYQHDPPGRVRFYGTFAAWECVHQQLGGSR